MWGFDSGPQEKAGLERSHWEKGWAETEGGVQGAARRGSSLLRAPYSAGKLPHSGVQGCPWPSGPAPRCPWPRLPCFSRLATWAPRLHLRAPHIPSWAEMPAGYCRHPLPNHSLQSALGSSFLSPTPFGGKDDSVNQSAALSAVVGIQSWGLGVDGLWSTEQGALPRLITRRGYGDGEAWRSAGAPSNLFMFRTGGETGSRWYLEERGVPGNQLRKTFLSFLGGCLDESAHSLP